MANIDRSLAAAPVVPVLVIERIEDAVPVARALVQGGPPVLKVTLCTPVALDAIRAMRTVEGTIVGAGAILDPAQLEQALAAGSNLSSAPA